VLFDQQYGDLVLSLDAGDRLYDLIDDDRGEATNAFLPTKFYISNLHIFDAHFLGKCGL
jgi:hypothetical protein